MKRILKVIGIVLAIVVIGIFTISLLSPWMDRWGATDDEILASFPGDELVPSPIYFYTRAVTVKAAPQQIYPWLVQMGAERGGLYSYTWFETYILQCKLVNADHIHEEWQDLQAGDQVKMCPGNFGPVPFDVGSVDPNHSVIMGHYANEAWIDTWQFILVPRVDGTTRLILRSRDMKTGGIWNVIHPGQFIMERGMLLGIKERAEHLAETAGRPVLEEITPTPEVFIPLDQVLPDQGITLEGVHLEIVDAVLSGSFPADCAGSAPTCTQAPNGYKLLSVKFAPRDLRPGQMLAYKNLPLIRIAMGGGANASYSLTMYDNTAHTLTLGFEVPESATVFALKWADLREIPLEIAE